VVGPAREVNQELKKFDAGFAGFWRADGGGGFSDPDEYTHFITSALI
jgi:hypothetical protein